MVTKTRYCECCGQRLKGEKSCCCEYPITVREIAPEDKKDRNYRRGFNDALRQVQVRMSGPNFKDTFILGVGATGDIHQPINVEAECPCGRAFFKYDTALDYQIKIEGPEPL